MKTFILFILVICTAKTIHAEEFDYKRVMMAGTGFIENTLVRYLYSSESPCIFIQNLVDGGRGTVSTERKICSLDGKSFYNGYAEVALKKGIFKEGKLFFELEVTPLRSFGEKIMFCEVVFHNGLTDHLSCKEKLTEENSASSFETVNSRTTEVAAKAAE